MDVSGDLRRLPPWAPVVTLFAVLVAWSTYAYLTVRFNSDIIVEAIAVQDLLRDPSWVWSYPGQLHGGIVEYPIMAVGELIAPGNAYGFTFIRIFYVPVTGVLVALSLRRAFPSVNLWWFAAAAAAGPALLHDFRAISDIYPFGWLLAAIGVYLIAGKRFLVVGGIFLGLGVYEHATAALMSLPLVLALAIRWGFGVRAYLRVGVGLVPGLIPMALAQFAQPDKIVVWAPADLTLPRAVDLFGLAEGGAAWSTAILPGAWGIQNGGINYLGIGNSGQFVLNLVLALAVLAFCLVGGWLVLRGRSTWKDPLGFLVIVWTSGLVLALLLSAVVPTVWFYGLSLGFLVWVTVALAAPTRIGRVFAVVVIAVMASMSIFSVNATGGVVGAASSKWEDNQEIRGVAESLIENNVDVIFGDYWEVLPVAYASSGKVFAVTSNFNRLPIPDSIAQSPEVLVGVTSGKVAVPSGRVTWDTAEAAKEYVSESCRFVSPLPGSYFEFVDIYRCAPEVLQNGIG